ncbi:MAG: protein jag [Dehalococcoidia bacterium]|nr:MAG: protein jag [Dehalococcoidia bacterium]
MERLEISAKSVEEAIQQALERLGVSREEVKVTVIKEGRHGILGLGAEEAKIRVEPVAKQDSDITEVAKGVLETLLTMMGVVASVVPQANPVAEEEEAATPINLDIKGDDLGILIGRRGQTLSCLQYIVRLIVGHQTEAWVPIIIDVEGYKQRRYETLRALAWRLAEQVKARGVPFTLEPMLAYERRIIHLALADHPDVTTESIGEGEARKVVIQPK